MAVLCRCKRGRTGENAPAFAVELVYLQRGPRDRRGEVLIDLLPSIFPCPRTGLLVPPHRVLPRVKPGVFRTETDAGHGVRRFAASRTNGAHGRGIGWRGACCPPSAGRCRQVARS